MADNIVLGIAITGEQVAEYIEHVESIESPTNAVEIDMHKLFNIENPDLNGLYVEFENWPETFHYYLPRNLKSVKRGDKELTDYEIYDLLRKYGTVLYLEWVNQIYEISEYHLDTPAKGYATYSDQVEIVDFNSCRWGIKCPFEFTDGMMRLEFNLYGYDYIPFKLLSLLSGRFADCEVFVCVEYPYGDEMAIQLVNGKIINTAITQPSTKYLKKPEN